MILRSMWNEVVGGMKLSVDTAVSPPFCSLILLPYITQCACERTYHGVPQGVQNGCAWCRQENGSLHDPPMETSFSHWNMLLLMQDENPIIGRIFVGNPNIRFLRCLPNRDVISLLNPPNSHDPNGGTYVRIGGPLKEK